MRPRPHLVGCTTFFYYFKPFHTLGFCIERVLSKLDTSHALMNLISDAECAMFHADDSAFPARNDEGYIAFAASTDLGFMVFTLLLLQELGGTDGSGVTITLTVDPEASSSEEAGRFDRYEIKIHTIPTRQTSQL